MNGPEDDFGNEAARFDPRLALIIYVRVLSAIFLVSGLQHWGRVLGIGLPGGDLLALPTPVVVATLFFSVANLVAAVGLWLLASWGTVVWMISALTETVLHSAFSPLFGSNRPLVIFHIASVLAYAGLTYLYERTRDKG